MAAVRTWDGVKRRWRFSKLGQRFYRDSQDAFAVTCLVYANLVRISNSVYNDTNVPKSTATELGEIKPPSPMAVDQLVEVKRVTEQFLVSLQFNDWGDGRS